MAAITNLATHTTWAELVNSLSLIVSKLKQASIDLEAEGVSLVCDMLIIMEGDCNAYAYNDILQIHGWDTNIEIMLDDIDLV